ncbi:hypothetical protein SLA2020_046090 [Shorea laevis]
MGCCFSSSATAATAAITSVKTDPNWQNSSKTQHLPPKPPVSKSHQNPAPSLPSPVKETVKEVLVISEAPFIHIKQQEKTQMPVTQESEIESKDLNSIEKQQFPVQKLEEEVSGFKDVSEIYSVTETITTSTTATTGTKDINEDEATSRQRKKVSKRSPAKVPRKHPYNVDSESVRAIRLETSSEKKARGRGSGMGQSGEMRTTQRTVVSKSRSPATGRAAGMGTGRGSVVRRSPAKATGKASRKSVSTAQKEEDENGIVLEKMGNASFENPRFVGVFHLSMKEEC